MIRSEAKCDIFAERAYVTFLLNVDKQFDNNVQIIKSYIISLPV